MEVLLALLQSKILDVFGKFLWQYLKDHIFKDQWTSKKPSPQGHFVCSSEMTSTLLNFRALSFPFAFHGFIISLFSSCISVCSFPVSLTLSPGFIFFVGVSLGPILYLLVILPFWMIPRVFSCVKSPCLAQANLLDPSPTFPLHLVIRFTLAYDSFYFLHN